MREPRLTPLTWQGYDILVLMLPGAAHSVWWFFADGAFTGWYVNLQDPCVRTDDGVDTADPPARSEADQPPVGCR
jgi:hypothetical protein